MDAGSERSQHQWNIHWDIHVEAFINSLVKIVMLCLVSLGLQRTWCNYLSAVLSSLGKLTSKLSSATHPVCSGTCNIIAATLWQLHCITFLRNTYKIVFTNYWSVSWFVLIVAHFKSICDNMHKAWNKLIFCWHKMENWVLNKVAGLVFL